MKTTDRFEQAIVEGGKAYMENRLPAGLPSSSNYDAALITMHVLYWCGRAPRCISAGYDRRGRRIVMQGGARFIAQMLREMLPQSATEPRQT